MSPGRHSGQQQQQQARVASPSHFETQTDTQDRPQHRSLMNSLTHLWSNVETRFLAPATDPDAPGCLSPHHFSPDPEQEHPSTSPTARRRRRRRAKGRSAKSPSAAWGPTHSSSSSSGSSHHSPSLNDQGGNGSHDGSVNHTVRSVGSADEQELFDTKMTTPVPPPRKQSSHHTADTTKASSSTSRSPRQPSPSSGYSPPNHNDSSKLKVTLERIVESASKTFAILSPSDKDSPRSHNSNSNNNRTHVKKLSFQDNVISIMDDPCSPCRGEVMEEEQDWDRYQDDNEDDDDDVGIGIQPLQAPFPPGQAEYAQAHSASSARSVQTASISAAERRRQRHYDQKSSQQQHILNHQRRRRQQKQRGGKEDDDDADARLEAKRISQQVAAIQKTSSQKRPVLVQPLNQKGKPLVGVDATTASSAFSLPFESVHLLESGMELDRSISELTMRSSYGEAMAPMTEHRRMAYYAVGKSTPTHTGVGGGGNRRCYFSGRSILGGAPFYAGSVQQGLRTLVVFLLPSALNLPEPHDLDRLLQKAQSSQSPPPTQSSKQSPKTSSLTQKNNLRSFRRSLNSRTSDPSLRTSGSTASGTHRSGASSPNTTYSSGTTTGTDDSMGGGGGGGVLMEDYYYNYLQLDREALLDVLPEPDQGFLDRLKETFPAEFATLPIQVRSPHCWRLFCDFCFFSGLPIAEGELHYRVKDGIARPQFNKEEDAANHSHRTDPIILSHEVMEAVNGESTDILRLPNMKTFRYLQKHYTQQCSKLTEQVFERSSWELVRPEV